MTNEERFEQYWQTVEGESEIVPKRVWESKREARAAYMAAAPPDDVREACIEAVGNEIFEASERIARYYSALPSRVPRARDDFKRFNAAREWLEGYDDD